MPQKGLGEVPQKGLGKRFCSVIARQGLAWNLRHLSRGFTLLEVLVVMVIIGVVISFAVLSLKGNDNSLDEEARRLQALIALAGQEAVLQSRELAMEFTSEGYDFLAFDGEQWQPISDDDVFRARHLPEDLVIEYQAEGDQLTVGKKDDEAVPPRIYFLSSGEATPFRLTLHHRGESDDLILSGDTRGKTELSGADDGQ